MDQTAKEKGSVPPSSTHSKTKSAPSTPSNTDRPWLMPWLIKNKYVWHHAPHFLLGFNGKAGLFSPSFRLASTTVTHSILAATSQHTRLHSVSTSFVFLSFPPLFLLLSSTHAKIA